MIGLIGLARPLRADINQVNQVKINHDRVARAIIKTILLSQQEFSIGGRGRAKKKPRANEHSTFLVVGGRRIVMKKIIF